MFTRFVPKSRIDRCPSFWVLLIVMALISGSPAQAATFTVTNLNDSGVGSLRQAVLDANAATDADIIFFDSKLKGGTIILTIAPLTISNTLTINGLGSNVLAISGNKTLRVLQIISGATVIIDGLTIKDGNNLSDRGDDQGGNIRNEGTLTISNSNLTGGLSWHGGGIYNKGTLFIINSYLEAVEKV